jgi:hypothetical protein
MLWERDGDTYYATISDLSGTVVFHLVVEVLVQFELEPPQAPGGSGIGYAAKAAFHTSDAVLSLRRNARRSNWPLWIRRSSSTPAIVIAAVLNHLNPSIGPMRSFTPRWSCSIRLLRYFDDRSFVSANNRPSAFISRTARCDAAYPSNVMGPVSVRAKPRFRGFSGPDIMPVDDWRAAVEVRRVRRNGGFGAA